MTLGAGEDSVGVRVGDAGVSLFFLASRIQTNIDKKGFGEGADCYDF